MKSYPSIPKDINPNINILSFDKLDGSLIRGTWNKSVDFINLVLKIV